MVRSFDVRCLQACTPSAADSVYTESLLCRAQLPRSGKVPCGAAREILFDIWGWFCQTALCCTYLCFVKCKSDNKHEYLLKFSFVSCVFVPVLFINSPALSLSILFCCFGYRKQPIFVKPTQNKPSSSGT